MPIQHAEEEWWASEDHVSTCGAVLRHAHSYVTLALDHLTQAIFMKLEDQVKEDKTDSRTHMLMDRAEELSTIAKAIHEIQEVIQ